MIKGKITDFTSKKEDDLNFILETAKNAMNIGEIKQAIKLCEKGLEEAKKSKNNEWINRFHEIHSQIKGVYLNKKFKRYNKRAYQEENIFRYEKAINYLKKAKKKLNSLYKLGKDLTKINKEIKRIDRKISELNEKLKFENTEVLNCDNNEISNDKNTEKEQLEKDFSGSIDEEAQLNDLNDELFYTDNDKNPEATNLNKNDKLPNEHDGILPNEQIISLDSNNLSEMSVSEKIKYLETKNKKDTQNNIFKEDLDHRTEEQTEFLNDDKEDYNLKRSHLGRERKEAKLERLSNNERLAIIQQVKNNFNSSGFYILKNYPGGLKKFFQTIEIIAVKVIHIKEMLDFILIVPIKVLNLKGSLIVSEEDIEYYPQNKVVIPEKLIDTWLESHTTELMNIQNYIFNDITTEGNFFQFLKKYLKTDLKIERTIDKKKLFLWNNQLQYKIIIDPVLICNNKTKFAERTKIIFPIQRTSNLHIINYNKSLDLLQFLENKYFFSQLKLSIKTEIEIHYKNLRKYNEDLKLYTLPFVIFGIIYVLIFILQLLPILEVLNILGIASIILYSIIMFYLTINYFKKRSEITKMFKTQFHLSPATVDESVFGKDSPYERVLSNTSSYDKEEIKSDKKTIIKKRGVESKKFEKKGIQNESGIKRNLVKKYKSFLDE
jgi:hypothetical protein